MKYVKTRDLNTGNPERYFRKVGNSGEILNLRYNGWYADNGSTIYKGVVYRLPHNRLLYGLESSDGWTSFDGTEIDSNPGVCYGARWFFSDELKEAAIQADRFAEREAEKAREWNQAWQDGTEYADRFAEAAQACTDLRVYLPSRFGAKGRLAEIVRGGVRQYVRSIRSARKRANALKDHYSHMMNNPRFSHLYAAFEEGAGL